MSVIIDHITKYYGRQKALNNVTFTLNKGEICGFLGPNGAGKSTLMKIITGYLEQYEGQIILNDIYLRKESLKAKSITGYLPEHNPLYPEMYIREYLLHIARLYHTPKASQKVDDILKLTGLLGERKKKINQLSKGYRQRVGLAQALIHDPEILILDEPMTGLDPNQLEDIRNLIIQLSKDKTVMLSTHVMQEVEAICDRIIVIDKGNIVADNTKDSFHASGSLSIYVHFAHSNVEWLKELKDIVRIEMISPKIYRLIAQAGSDPRIALFNAAAAHNNPILELKLSEKNLEETFKELTHK